MDLIQRANLTQVNNNERFIVFDAVFFLSLSRFVELEPGDTT